jgi:tetratricopeptide (TPR) repeat protein
LLLGAIAIAAPLPALAQQKGGPSAAAPAGAEAPLTEDQLKAQQHFQRAKDLYQQGAYREAIAELELARSLDPKAKDLVFNLGIVHEKLAKFDEAITYFRQYIEMEGVTAAEKQRAESIIKRIEGAKREIAAQQAPSATPQVAPTSAPPADNKPPPRGRIDALTIGAASLSVVGLGVGIGFGIRALSNRPSDFVTGRDGTYDDLETQQARAHNAAIVADVGFGVGIVAGIAAAYLYFSRTKDPSASSPRQGAPKPSALSPSASVAPGGGAVGVTGSF